MSTVEPLVRTLRQLRRVLEALEGPVPADRAADRERHAERAIDRYLAWADGSAAALTRKSAREAAWYQQTGEPARVLVAGLAHLKTDATDARLRDDRVWLWELKQRGVYEGPTALRRLRPDGSWEPLRLPGD